jgi:hypothetical protein
MSRHSARRAGSGLTRGRARALMLRSHSASAAPCDQRHCGCPSTARSSASVVRLRARELPARTPRAARTRARAAA